MAEESDPRGADVSTTACFCNTCNAPYVLYRDDGSPRFRPAANRESGGEDGCYREKFRNFTTSSMVVVVVVVVKYVRPFLQ